MEAQVISIFFKALTSKFDESGKKFPDPNPAKKDDVDFCSWFERYWANLPTALLIKTANQVTKPPTQAINWVAQEMPATQYLVDEFLLLNKEVNEMKKRVSIDYVHRMLVKCIDANYLADVGTQ